MAAAHGTKAFATLEALAAAGLYDRAEEIYQANAVRPDWYGNELRVPMAMASIDTALATGNVDRALEALDDLPYFGLDEEQSAQIGLRRAMALWLSGDHEGAEHEWEDVAHSEFEGIGAVMETSDEEGDVCDVIGEGCRLRVVSVLPDAPAEGADDQVEIFLESPVGRPDGQVGILHGDVAGRFIEELLVTLLGGLEPFLQPPDLADVRPDLHHQLHIALAAPFQGLGAAGTEQAAPGRGMAGLVHLLRRRRRAPVAGNVGYRCR